MENNYGMLLVLLFPALGGIIGFYLGKKNKETRNDWIDIVMLVELVMLVYLGYLIIGKGTAVSLVLSDLLGLGLSLTMDAIRLLFCVIAAVVFGIITLFMKESMKKETGSNRFYLFYMCTYSMVLGAFMTNNLFNFFMFITFTMLFAYPLILHKQDKPAMKNSRIYISFTVGGIAVVLTGLTIVFAYLGSVSYTGMYSCIMSNGGSTPVLAGGLLILIGFAVFAGLFPVQFQVTRGCSNSMIEISAVLTSIVSKLGILGIMILAADLFVSSALYGRILLVGGLLTAVWGLLITFTSTDIRKILMGVDVAVNGLNVLSIGLMVLCGASNGYAVRSSIYIMAVSALSLMVLYMVALEQVRKVKTYEIKGLIASGKRNKLLAAVCLLACASLSGVPGTAGFLAHSMLYKTVLTNVGWKWLIVVYIILWAFFMTAVIRIFMKVFVSKKEETIRILSKEEKLQEETGTEDKSKKRNPYLLGEIMLLLVGLLQVAVGVFPEWTVDKLADSIIGFLNGEKITDAIPYYTSDAIIGFTAALVLCIFLYMNLVHGILLRAIRNKKNKKLQENINE